MLGVPSTPSPAGPVGGASAPARAASEPSTPTAPLPMAPAPTPIPEAAKASTGQPVSPQAAQVLEASQISPALPLPVIPEAAKVEGTVPATLQVASAEPAAPISPMLVEDTQETQAATPSLLRAHAVTRLDSLEDELNALVDQAEASLPATEPQNKDAVSRTMSTLVHASSFEDQSLAARVVKAPDCPIE